MSTLNFFSNFLLVVQLLSCSWLILINNKTKLRTDHSVVLLSSLIKILDKSVKRFMSYDQIYKQTEIIYIYNGPLDVMF